MVTGDGVAAGGRRATAAFAESIIREVGRVKPLREHMRFVQSVDARGAVGIQAAIRIAGFERQDVGLTIDSSPDWANFLQTEDGEPLQGATSNFLDTRP